MFEIMEEKLQVGETQVGAAQQLDEFQKVGLTEGAQAPRQHRIPDDGDRDVTPFRFVQHKCLLL